MLMFKTQTGVLLTGLAAYIIYIIGFSFVFRPFSLGIMFYIAAFCLFLGYLLYISDFYPESEAHEMKESPSDGAKYKPDESYRKASLAAVFFLLLSVTPLLVLMLLKQHGIFDSGWLIRVLAFLGGYLLLYPITLIYQIGETNLISGLVWYNDFMTRPKKSVTMQEVLESIEAINPWMSTESHEEAKGMVKKVLVEVLGVDERDVTNSASLVNDLGTDALDGVEIILKINDELSLRYGRDLDCLKHSDRESMTMKRFIDWNERSPHYKRYSDEIFRYYNELFSIVPKVLDLIELVGEAVHRFKRNL